MNRTTPTFVRQPPRPNLSEVLAVLTGVSPVSADSLARDQTLRLNPRGLEVWTHGEHTEEIPWKIMAGEAWGALWARGLLPTVSDRKYWCTRCDGLGYVPAPPHGAHAGGCVACGAVKCFACEGPGEHSRMYPTLDWIATLASLERGSFARVETVLQGMRRWGCGSHTRFPPLVWRVGEPLPQEFSWTEGEGTGSPREKELGANLEPKLRELSDWGFLVSGPLAGTLVITVPPIGYEPPFQWAAAPPPRPKFEPL